jgi:flagellar motor switch protein FliG
LRERLSGQGYSDDLTGKEMLLGILEHSDPEVRERFLTTGLKAKLCDFEDLEGLDEMALHQVLRLINWSDLEAAMQGASAPLVERVARFLTPDNAQAVRKAVGGASYSKDEVVGARRQICNILRGLVSLGKVHLSRR